MIPCKNCLMRGMCSAKVLDAYETSIMLTKCGNQFSLTHTTKSISSILDECSILREYATDAEKPAVFGGMPVMSIKAVDEIVIFFLR